MLKLDHRTILLQKYSIGIYCKMDASSASVEEGYIQYVPRDSEPTKKKKEERREIKYRDTKERLYC